MSDDSGWFLFGRDREMKGLLLMQMRVCLMDVLGEYEVLFLLIDGEVVLAR